MPIDQRGQGPARGIGDWPMDQDRCLPIRAGWLVVGMVGERRCAILGYWLDLVGRGKQLTAVVQQRKAGVDVVGDHVRHDRVAQVLDCVVDEQSVLAQARPDAAGQLEVLAEDDCLACPTLRPHDKVVALPLAVDVHVARLEVGRPPVEWQLLAGIGRRPASGGQAAGGHQAAAEATQPALTWWFVERGGDFAG